MKCLPLLILAQLFLPVAFAQTKSGRINGAVKDNNGKYLESVTVSLLKFPDSALIKTVLTNKEGQFVFDNIPSGHYLMSVTFVGYSRWTSQPFQISSSRPNQKMNDISLQSSVASLGEVTVTGKRPPIENKIDKTVVNVDASITNAGNTVMEVLEKSPYISIDKDGNIVVKGKTGVIILIDGKQTYLSGQDLIDLLKNMSAAQVDQIEIMTQPSAKYDASGNAGIINIKTKHSQQRGFNGSVTLSYVQAIYPKSPNSINLNYRDNKFNFFGNFNISYWEGFSDITINRYFVDKQEDINSHFAQSSDVKFNSHPFNWKMGVDFYQSQKNTFGMAFTGQLDNRKSYVYTLSNLYDLDLNGTLNSTSEAWTNSTNKWANLGFNLNFKREIDKKGRELTTDFDYIWYDTRSIQQSNNYTYNPDGSLDTTSGAVNPYLLHGNLPSIIKIYTGKADYTHPIDSTSKIEAGWKSSYVQTDNDAQYSYFVNGSYQTDTSRTNHFLYQENINAVYINYNKQFKKWSVQAGLRMEQTYSRGNQVVKNQKFDTSYVQLFPTVFLSYALNPKSQFTLSYGRRIDRPNYQDMNPFQYFLDQYTYRQGNPYLQPQFSHNVELSYNYKGELNLSANYTQINNVINDILVQNDSTKVTYQTKENVSSETNVGLSLSYNKQLTKWWNISLSGNIYNDHYTGIVDDAPLDVSLTAFVINMNNQFSFGKGWGAEASGFYNSKMLYSGLIVAEPMEVISFGFSKQVFKNKGSIKLNLRDPFYIMHFSGYTQFSNINFNVYSRWDNRRVGIVFTYRFGKKMNNQPARKKDSSTEEQNRVGGGNNQQ